MKSLKILGAVTSFLSSCLGGKKEATCCALLLAAGSGTRMGGIKKCFLPLGDKTVLEHALLSFEASPFVTEIIIVTKADQMGEAKKLPAVAHCTKPIKIVEGGDTRLDSASRGFYAVSEDVDFVAIHDAARPFITVENITEIFKAAKKTGAACASHPITDTVKRANKDGFIKETVDRDGLFAVQTPQIFKKSLYAASLALALKDQISVTDDCMMAEHAGFRVKLVDTGKHNIKLTRPEDYAAAQIKHNMEEF